MVGFVFKLIAGSDSDQYYIDVQAMDAGHGVHKETIPIETEKKTMKRSAVTVLSTALLIGQAYADSYSHVTRVKGLTLQGSTNTVRIVLEDSTGSYEPCATDSWYAFSLADQGGKEMYATLLAAKLSGNNLFLQSIGCLGPYSKVTLVYVCDTLWCQ
jgi:hypothetical protein